MDKRKGCVGSIGWFPCKACDLGYGSEACNGYRRSDNAKVRSEEISDFDIKLVRKYPCNLPQRYREMRP